MPDQTTDARLTAVEKEQTEFRAWKLLQDQRGDRVESKVDEIGKGLVKTDANLANFQGQIEKDMARQHLENKTDTRGMFDTFHKRLDEQEQRMDTQDVYLHDLSENTKESVRMAKGLTALGADTRKLVATTLIRGVLLILAGWVGTGFWMNVQQKNGTEDIKQVVLEVMRKMDETKAIAVQNRQEIKEIKQEPK